MLSPEVIAQLESEGFTNVSQAQERWRAHAELLREWSKAVSLVSIHDLNHLDAHFIDSLSLAHLVRQYADGGLWLDVGSGGGFPAIPIAVLLPDQELALVERSEKKAGFLRKLSARLGLRQVRVLMGEFPAIAHPFSPKLITARAVEKPERIGPAIARTLEPGGIYLDQRPLEVSGNEKVFHVEHYGGVWEDRRWRRGGLRIAKIVHQNT